MASPQWLEIYQSYSADELTAEIIALKARNTGFVSQGSPTGKNYQADLNEMREQLSAAVRVQTEMGGGGQPRSGVVDFSRMSDNSSALPGDPGRMF